MTIGKYLPLFPRGEGPLVSVLLPTRQRVPLLIGALHSFADTVNDPSRVEIILKVDDDDQPTIDAMHQFALTYPIKMLLAVSPRGNGYKDLHVWLNAMAGIAKGDWLLVWNDDARILTMNWDLQLEKCDGGYQDEIFVMLLHTTSRPGSREFMFVRKKMVEVLGHMSLSPHVDAWLGSLGSMLQRIMFMPMQVNHFNDLMADKVSQERREATKITNDEYDSIPMCKRKLQDLQKLIDHIEANS